ncbi:MAG: 2-phospho-L-lactate guanylyltransferase [Pseudomonadota bacterium]
MEEGQLSVTIAPDVTRRAGGGRNGDHLSSRGLGDDSRTGCGQPEFHERAYRLVRDTGAIGRVEQDQVEGSPARGQSAQRGGDRGHDHLGPAGEPAALDILPQDASNRGRLLDRDQVRRASRERLDAECAGAGEEVENPPAGDRVTTLEDPEERLAQATRARPDREPARTAQRPPLGLARDHAHRAPHRRHTPCYLAKASGGRKKEVVMLWALVPAKLGAEAKRRLAPGLDVGRRRVLARAMLVDVLAALRASPSIDGVAVVGRGAPLDALAAELGVTAVAERTASSLNEAVAEGLEACVARGAVAVLVAMADLPLLRVDDVERMVAASRDTEVAVAVSRDGTGTNLMLLRPPGAIATAFGTGSLALHRAAAQAAGRSFAAHDVPGAALDVDTPEDLALLRASAVLAGASRDALGGFAPTSSVPSASHSSRGRPSRPS